MVSPRDTDTPGWTIVGGWTAGDAVPGLPGVWSSRWQPTGESIQVTDPLYGNPRTLTVHEVPGDRGPLRFAVTEVSNSVYLFAVPSAPR